jgi:transcriptional regulator GlxA family with amidase domain
MASVTTIAGSRRLRSNERIVSACLLLAENLQYHDVTMTALCGAAGASERRVRHAFVETVGVSPMPYLRSVALESVRRALEDNPFERDAVTRAASDFGFSHLSRFAGHYRTQFGESPRDTVFRLRQSIANHARTCAS